MAENPNTWTWLEEVISAGMREADENHRNMVIGYSTPRIIADKIREAAGAYGIDLKEKDES